MDGSPRGFSRGFLGAVIMVIAVAILTPARAAAGPEVETRDFTVLVEGKPAGDVHMTIYKQEDGSIILNCDLDVKVTIKIGPLTKNYTYSYRDREVWKGGRVQRFDSTCNDDGKRFDVNAVAEGDKLRLRVNTEERLVRGDVWLSSYWAMPDKAKINQTVPIIDADTGRDLSAKVSFVGVEQRTVAGQPQKVNHFRLTGGVQMDLWYDVTGRLVAQDWVEDGRRMQVELNRLRR
jgi:hypothetical protein